jgi:hypothetical protein
MGAPARVFIHGMVAFLPSVIGLSAC